ncbi:MAG: four-carbon acid sugar kinase family protein [Saprospiraceae bacterium]|nr:four-carbon acid sugar kinase family protein [Saprospiraceae bacterium]
MQRNKLLLIFYGDDFTGSTDVMETLAINGIPTLLFLKTPTASEVENIQLKRRFGGSKLRAFGVAGIGRSLDPVAMQKELDPIFSALAKFPADYFLYKVCSTLDSAPHVGNIGTAMAVALKYFPSTQIPCIVGAPFLNRFVVFGNLFARLDNKTYRLDRHPVMSLHPVTPMQESDIGRHLSRQTDLKMKSVNLLQMQSGLQDAEVSDQTESDPKLIIFDTLSNDDLQFLGDHLYNSWQGGTQLVLGSSGASYGLAKYVLSQENIQEGENIGGAEIVSQIFVVSGSCSPVTERQIRYCLDLGFAGVRMDVIKLIARQQEYLLEVLEEVAEAFRSGRSAIVYTALGPSDPSIHQIQGMHEVNLNAVLGPGAAHLFAEMISRFGQIRCVVVGGDTSGYVSRQLGIYALEMLAPIAPGAPLCVAHATDVRFDGLEIALKGGQNGKDDYFEKILKGH